MPKSSSIQTPPHQGSFARVVFAKQSDRWTHRIEWVSAAKTVLIATSIEGTADCNWPPSQPLQEISQVELDGRPVLLGLGMAGRSHWSLSCSLEPESSKLAGAFLFDLACLAIHMPPGWLGSSYQFGPDATISHLSNNGVMVSVGNDCGIFVATRNGQPSNGVPGSVFQIADDQLQIRPARISTSPTIATRWAFAIEVAKQPPLRE